MNSPVDKMLDSARSLPSIPKALQEVMQTLNKADLSISELTDPLSQDPALSAKVLRMSNSAHFGLPKQVSSIDEAVLLVGVDAIRTLVIASGLMGSFDALPGFDMKRFWRLALLSGMIGRDLGREAGSDPEQIYTAALMHNLGVLAIHGAFPDVVREVDAACNDTSANQRAMLEMKILGFHHGEVGAEIARAWRLPDVIGHAIRFYPYPERSVAPVSSGLIFCAVELAIDIEDGKPASEWGLGISDTLLERVSLERELFQESQDDWLKHRDFTDSVVS